MSVRMMSPDNVVVDAEVGMGQAVPGPYDAPPLDFRMRLSHGSRNMRCGYADQFNIP